MKKWKKILTTPKLTPSPDIYTCDKNVFDGLKESLTGVRFEDLNSFSTINEFKMQRHLQMVYFRRVPKFLERCKCEGEK